MKSDPWLIELLESPAVIGGVLEVWARLPYVDRLTLRALQPAVIERDLRSLTGQLGLHMIDTDDDGSVRRRWIVLDRDLSYQEAAAVFAHEASHVVLRHGELTAGELGLENLEVYVEGQAKNLAARWGFPWRPHAKGRNGHHSRKAIGERA